MTKFKLTFVVIGSIILYGVTFIVLFYGWLLIIPIVDFLEKFLRFLFYGDF